MRCCPRLPSTLLGCFLLWTTATQAADRASVSAALATVTVDELQAHVDVLADDTFEGREAGSRGGQAASIYLLKYFKQKGLDGAGDHGGYFQSFDAGYRNVLGLLPGSDPDLRDEVVLIGAHYDHVGYGNRRNSYGPFGYVHNGADDNASGTAGLLEAIDAFVSLAQRPRRSILFALWDGEEKGLLGSKHWVSSPTMPLERVVFAFNMDMIGRLRDSRLEVYGTRTSYGLRRLLSLNNREADLRLDFTWEMKANSDHHSFFSHDIPVVMLHTGLHDDYHRPSDDAHKVDAQGMRRVTQLLVLTAHELADRPEPLSGFRTASRREGPVGRTAINRPGDPPPPRLGVSWQNGAGGAGLLLTRVFSGTAAERAGLRIGDRLMRVNGQDITDEGRLRRVILAARRPLQVALRRGEMEHDENVEIDLSGHPVRLGISWRLDDAEPGMAIVSSVVPGSAAEMAGVQPGDRLYEISGFTFQDSEQLQQLADRLPSPIELMLERDGRIRNVKCEVAPPGVVAAE